MPAERLSMRTIREVLRLKWEKGMMGSRLVFQHSSRLRHCRSKSDYWFLIHTSHERTFRRKSSSSGMPCPPTIIALASG